MIQAKTALILQMATEQDEIKIRQYPGMMKNFDVMNRNNKRNPLMIVYGIPSEMKENEVIEEMIDRNLNDITEEQKQLVKPRFKTGPKKQDRYHLVFEVPKQVRERILRSPRVYIGYEVTDIKDFLVVTTCLKCHEYGHIAAHCINEARCGNCSDKSHKKQDCPNKDKKYVYATIQGGRCVGQKAKGNAHSTNLRYKE